MVSQRIYQFEQTTHTATLCRPRSGPDVGRLYCCLGTIISAGINGN